MKLEVGKYYKAKNGQKVGPLEPYDKAYLKADGGQMLFYIYDGTRWNQDPDWTLISEWEDEMKITMDGKYAYRYDPYTQVRILCVDRNNPANPILSLAADGRVDFHSPTGVAPYLPDHDLVPLQEKLPDLWVLVYEDGGTYSFPDKATAEAWVEDSLFKPKLYKYIPAPDQTS